MIMAKRAGMGPLGLKVKTASSAGVSGSLTILPGLLSKYLKSSGSKDLMCSAALKILCSTARSEAISGMIPALVSSLPLRRPKDFTIEAEIVQ